LRYGENSHQLAEVYNFANNNGVVNALQIQGKELSYNNFNDADSAFNLVLEFKEPTCAIIKHANPCGVASSSNILDAYKKALACDAKSAFGGIIALNYEIDENLAQEIAKIFYEDIIAPSITKKAREILSSKKNLRILIADFAKNNQRQIKTIAGGFLVQDFDNDVTALKYVRIFKSTRKHLLDLQKAKIMVITQENLKLLFENKLLQEYETFYDEFY
jgi:phosphoribosylaminoimidazolecarboxamide formyltransferase/IMP cyclohydrolase